MKSILFFALAVISVHAQAATPFDKVTVNSPVCYGREYSQAHMDKKRVNEQTVKSLKLKFSLQEDAPADFYVLKIDAEVVNTKANEFGEIWPPYKPYTNTMFCDLKTAQAQLLCYIECDGGSAVVSWDIHAKSYNSISFKNNGFVLYGGCGGDGNEEDMIWLDNKAGGDDIFTVYALPKEYCQ